MPTLDIIKAWKDEDFRDTLTMEQRAVLPEHPSGTIEFQESRLGENGLFEANPIYTKGGCTHHGCTVYCTR